MCVSISSLSFFLSAPPHPIGVDSVSSRMQQQRRRMCVSLCVCAHTHKHICRVLFFFARGDSKSIWLAEKSGL